MLASGSDWQRFVILAPAFVIGAGVILAVLIVLGRALAQNVRESGHQRLIMVGFVALAGVVAILTYLGVELPRE